MSTVIAESARLRLGLAAAGTPLSPEEFDTADCDQQYRYELINGVLVVTPAPLLNERDPNEELGHWLRDYRDRHPNGTALDLTVPEHDILIGDDRRRADRAIWAGLGRLPRPDETPTVVVEFVSAGKRNLLRDYEHKRAEYETIGVREYWVFNRFDCTLTVFRPGGDRQVYGTEQTYTTILLSGFELPLTRLFEFAKPLDVMHRNPDLLVSVGNPLSRLVCWFGCLLAMSGCSANSKPSVSPDDPTMEVNSPIHLTDVSEAVGIDFMHFDGSSGLRYIVEPMSAGVALFDFDGDGWIDVYLLNGAPLPGAKVHSAPTNALYRNLGDWRFEEVTDQARVGDTNFGLGVTVGDYDNDGDPDLYLNNHGPNVLYRNEGDGTFTDVTQKAGVGNGDYVGAGTSFLDMDADGDLDLYVANYLEFQPADHTPVVIDGFSSYPSPLDYPGVPDTVFRNNGDGTFTDVSMQCGVASIAGTGMGMVCADYDRDGDTDVFVLNDVAENFFFENDGEGNFQEVGVTNGTAYNWCGDANASMGVDCGDYDNDGWLDFVMTSYQSELPALYRNLGIGAVEDVAQTSGVGTDAFPYVNWGVGLVDFDNDGNRDIYIANGHTEDNIEIRDTTTTYKAPNLLLRNEGDGQFVNITSSVGSGLAPIHASRGTGFDDLDNDGDIDVVVLNSREGPTWIRNDSKNSGHWLGLRLYGRQDSRDAIGASVKVVTDSVSLVDEVHSGRGYQSHYGSRLHFGLGASTQIDAIEIRWMTGQTQRIENCPVDCVLAIIEGHSDPIRLPYDLARD